VQRALGQRAGDWLARSLRDAFVGQFGAELQSSAQMQSSRAFRKFRFKLADVREALARQLVAWMQEGCEGWQSPWLFALYAPPRRDKPMAPAPPAAPAPVETKRRRFRFRRPSLPASSKPRWWRRNSGTVASKVQPPGAPQQPEKPRAATSRLFAFDQLTEGTDDAKKIDDTASTISAEGSKAPSAEEQRRLSQFLLQLSATRDLSAASEVEWRGGATRLWLWMLGGLVLAAPASEGELGLVSPRVFGGAEALRAVLAELPAAEAAAAAD
jgi:hypothetical protein